jgi:hypothetical protein
VSASDTPRIPPLPPEEWGDADLESVADGSARRRPLGALSGELDDDVAELT